MSDDYVGEHEEPETEPPMIVYASGLSEPDGQGNRTVVFSRIPVTEFKKLGI